MDADIYEQILSGMDPSRSKVTAAKLRAQGKLGDLARLSLNEPTAQWGGEFSGRAQSTATKMGEEAAQKAYRDQTLAQQKARDLQQQAQFEQTKAFQAEQNRLQRALQRELAQVRAESTMGSAMKDLWRYRKDLGRDMTKAGIPEIKKGISQVDEALAPYGEGNLPGFGLGKYSPSQEARALRGKLQPIENILLKARSGAAVTDQEYERFRKELLGEGVLASDADFRRAWADLKSRVEAMEQGIYQAYDPAIVEIYQNDIATGAGGPTSATQSISGPAGLMMGNPEDYWSQYGE